MTFRDLQKLVAQGEGLHLEFKRKVKFPDKVVREVVAFANTEGGILAIGVDDNGTLPGVSAADEEEFEMERAIIRYCHPAIEYTIERVAVPRPLAPSERGRTGRGQVDRGVVLFHITAGAQKPYEVRQPPAEVGKAYVRVRDRTVQASREVRQILRQQRREKSFRFEYGEKERVLMRHLDTHGAVTVGQFALAAGVPRGVASRTMVLLTLAGVLRIIPDEGEDRYRRTDAHLRS